ncbi:MAG: hypothetical protein JSV44_08325, partial [Candidatus Zixiibacteriota bacterium]
SLLAVFIIFAAAVIYLIIEVSHKPERLDIVAHFESFSDREFALQGRVLSDGKSVDSALVWAVLKDTMRNKCSPEGVWTTQKGEFKILSDSVLLDTVKEVTVYARKDSKASGDAVEGNELLRGSRRIKLNVLIFIVFPVIFIISFLVPFLTLNWRWKYGISIVSGILFAFGMIVLIGAGLYHINMNYSPEEDETLSLGFASVIHNTYVPDVAKDWIFTLSSPLQLSLGQGGAETEQPGIEGGHIIKSFGAPLWVLLLAVVGSAVLTVSIVVSEIKNRPNFSLLYSLYDNEGNPGETEYKELEEFRSRLDRVIRHQFNILFSPIGAIFVYQSLVLTDAANNLIFVAFAAFGAGAALSIILDKAIGYAQEKVVLTISK